MKNVLLALMLTAPAYAWDFRGHRVVAELAWEFLDHSTREWVEECLLHHEDPRARDRDGAAVWPDMLRDDRPESMPWHFINLPIPSGPAPQKDDNVVAALHHFRRQAVEQPEPTKRAEALAFLIHFVGDVHQPLHAANYYSPEYPTGDQGGGKVELQHPWCKNLHQFWDLAGTSPDITAGELKQQVHRHGVTENTKTFDPDGWAKESHELALQHGYPFGLPPAQIDDLYAEQTRVICRKRMLLAGLRLAQTLHSIGPNAGVHRP